MNKIDVELNHIISLIAKKDYGFYILKKDKDWEKYPTTLTTLLIQRIDPPKKFLIPSRGTSR